MRKITKKEIQKSVLAKQKIAAYCRVSADTERLEHSLKQQIDFYEKTISSHPGWEFVGIYYDEFISGTQIHKREGFKKLIQDCEEGKITILLCKSISRFGRNTVDVLETIRKLSALHISVRFEKENLDTQTEEGELMLSLIGSFAQEESRSISENIKWGIRKRFEKGKTNHFILYGYKWDGTEFHIVPEEAEVVKRIYTSYLLNISPERLAKEFVSEGIRSAKDKRFSPGLIRRILANISYTGTDLLQKEYITDHLTHKRKKNTGELDMYRVEGARPQIITDELFDKVQAEMKRRREIGRFATVDTSKWHPLSRKIICGCCGATFRRHVKTRGSNVYATWFCRTKNKKREQTCPSARISESKLFEIILTISGAKEITDDFLTNEIEKIVVSENEVTINFIDKEYKEEIE